jgi:4-aminobutyrate aminotransferase-like enzyme/Ser/Thr protein kinase RdoA (MazF antagonist)
MDKILATLFGLLNTNIERLNGYDNVNYRISSDSQQFLFKTYAYSEEILGQIRAENETLKFLQSTPSKAYPAPIPAQDGSYEQVVELDGKRLVCRLLTFLEGDFFAEVEHTEALVQSLGTVLAETDLKLSGFNSYTISARQWEWDIQYLSLNKKYIDEIPLAKNRNLVRYFFEQYHENVAPHVHSLRKQVIHNDCNEWNILTQEGKVSGLIDFGDLAHSYLINEVAVACTYVCYDKENPLHWASIFIASYHSNCPLEEKELSLLYYLIAARLCISVCNSAHASKVDPDNSYATSSESYAWAMLYRWISINPLAAENTFRKATGMLPLAQKSTAEVLERRHQHISPVLSTSYEEPIHMIGSAFQYMYDSAGNTFLDAYNNIPHVGHGHPRVVAAGQRQMAKLNTNTRYLYPELADYAEKLLATFPSNLSKVFFVNSGSAASDLAIRMAKAHTGHKKIMVMEHGYHGNTQTAIEISDYKFNNPKGEGQKVHILKTNIPDTYRGKYRGNGAGIGKRYAQDAIAQMAESGHPIAAFITEPIIGCGGQVPLATGYLQHLYPAVRAQGGVCVSDEVQTGFGRLGDYFWGFEAQDVIPDIVILGKPMANGHPMGAVVCSDAVAESFGKGVEFFSSFGGNPVSCAIASSVLDVIAEEGLQENARDVGEYYSSLLMGLQQKYPCIGDVRGSGLFLGIEIIKGPAIEPDTALAQHIKNELRQRHILMSTDGPHDSVLKTKPPLCFTKENAKKVVDTIEEILAKALV